MNKTKVSVIVPVYNVEKYLPQCMDSLLNQTLKELEIILVDDGSPDNCPALCDEYAKQFPHIKVIHKKNGGLGYARNSGMEIAEGEYIAFVDSDDYVESETFQKLYTLARETNADVVYFTFRIFDDQGNTWGMPWAANEKGYHTEEDLRGYILDMAGSPPKAKDDHEVPVSVWSGFYRNDIIRKHELRFKNERELINEDLLFNIEFLLKASHIYTVPDAFYRYRTNLSSLSRSVRPDKIIKNYIYYQYLLEMLRENNFGTEGYLRATRHFIGTSRRNIRQYVQSSLTRKEKIQWLQEVVNHPVWREIASSYPYRQMLLKYAIHFYLLQKGYYNLLYYLSGLKSVSN